MMAGRCRPRCACGWLVLGAILGWGPGAAALSSASRQAQEQASNLDYAAALASAERAVAEDAQDPAAHRTLASILSMLVLFQRGTITSDSYLGEVSSPTVTLSAPDPHLARRLEFHLEQALTLAQQQVRARPSSALARYELGAAHALHASYLGTVLGKVVPAGLAARRAYQASESALSLDPTLKDAALVLGSYRYLVSNLPAPLRFLVSLAGIPEGRSEALTLVEAAARHGQETRTAARLLLVILYNRERRPADALAVLESLQQDHPRNRHLRLEWATTALRAGRAAAADAVLDRGWTELAQDPRPRAFGEPGLWLFKRGLARLALDRDSEAEADFRQALAQECRDWVKGRVHAQLGKLADRRGDHAAAQDLYRRATRMAQDAEDPLGRAEAAQLAASGFQGGKP